MNFLAHLYLAELTGTSAAGQMLGDLVKGRLDGRFDPCIETGIRLHRSIDGFTDRHPVTADLRRLFSPPLRRYAGILVDIGYDHCLARNWAWHSSQPLPQATRRMMMRVQREWPRNAPVPARRFAGLDTVMADYRQPAGLQRALDSVSRRLQNSNPLSQALPALLDQHGALAEGFDVFFPALCEHARRQAGWLRPNQ